ncbi:unnamed protein product [Heligmosomoides polygyrus]|uniref:Uncharacterized protein n=1 Tax=Heligmosomoides polygyrus TaxID=6339 RepID=A0A183FXH8_HELPZ|nr:unnamed protein product [Heligmosomoides polygyrus]
MRPYTVGSEFQLNDDAGNKTDRVKLKCSMTHRKKYQAGHSDLFLLVDQPSLGRLKSIDLMFIKKERQGFCAYVDGIPSRTVDSSEMLQRAPFSVQLVAEGDPFPIVPVDLSQTFE